ncbi:MAG TPA: hypothetical protein DCO86_02525 [Spirochaetaceae bacterium]|nr:hypothetical protein [Spirochaetaceae bacterium]
MNDGFFKSAKSVLAYDGKAAIVKVSGSKGSTPGKKGHVMLIRENGMTIGTVGGGRLEVHCVEAGKKVIAERKGFKEALKLDVKGEFDLEMACSGEIELEYEFFENSKGDVEKLKVFVGADLPSPRLIIIGAGHVSQSLGPIMKAAGFEIAIADDRPEFANHEVHPEASECIVTEYASIGKVMKFKKDDYVAIMTQGHKGDIDALLACAGTPDLKYIGLIGSSTKVTLAFSKLREAGIPEDKINSIYAPIGIKNGGRSAQEIAISIACQIIGVRYGYY